MTYQTTNTIISIFFGVLIGVFLGVFLMYKSVIIYAESLDFKNSCLLWEGEYINNQCIFKKIPTLNF